MRRLEKLDRGWIHSLERCSVAVLRTAPDVHSNVWFRGFKWWVACDGHNLRSMAAYAAGHRRGSLPSLHDLSSIRKI